MKRGGLSEVVTSVIMILLVIIAIAIIWVVVASLLNKSSSQVSTTQFTNGVKITKAEISLTEAKITVERTAGSANLTALKFVFSNGGNTYTYENNTPQLSELGSNVYVIPLQNGISQNAEVKVYPVYGSTIGTQASSKLNPNYLIEKDNGLVAYYPFNGDANDYSGNGKDGVITNAVYNQSGKINGAFQFNGTGSDYIQINDKNLLNLASNTVCLWFKPYDTINTNRFLFYVGESGGDGFGGQKEFYLYRGQ